MAFKFSWFVLFCMANAWGQTATKDAPPPAAGGDIPAQYSSSSLNSDYVKREVMIPMRDGVKLFTVIVVPKDAHNAPIVLTRTPYDAAHRMARMRSGRMRSILGTGDDIFADGDYIRVFQDVRG